MQNGLVKVQVTTLTGEKIKQDRLTEPIGEALRIAPAFLASSTDDDTGIETLVTAHYDQPKGRYIVTSVTNRAVRDDFDTEDLRRISIAPILQAAIPWCVSYQMDAPPDEMWVIVADLAQGEGLLPPWLVEAVTKRGAGDERSEAISIIYGAAALAGLPPVRAVQRELGIPHRTASDWIKKARKAGYLEGMTYAIGRQAEN